MYNIGLTGHRPDKLAGYDMKDPFYQKMYLFLREYILKKNGPVTCHSGMALGADTVFAWTALTLKEEGHDIKLVCHVPCENQEQYWRRPAQDAFREIIERADEVIVHSKQYSKYCMQHRNIKMTDASDEMIAIWDGTPGGTANCVNYAKSVDKKITIVDPGMFRV